MADDDRRYPGRGTIVLIVLIILAIIVVAAIWWWSRNSQRSNNLAAPTNLAATTQNSTINLTWNSVSGATGYKIYVSTQSGVNFNQKGATYPVDQNNASLNLAPGTYYFRVSSLKNCNGRTTESNTLSNEVSAKTPTCTNSNLAAPSALVAESQGVGTVELEWQGVLDASSYNVYRAQGRDVTVSDYDQKFNTQATEVLFTGLAAQSSQSFLVTAQDACGNETGPSPVVDFTVDCNAPSSVEVTQVSASSTSITVGWAALDGVDTYVVYLKEGTSVGPGNYDQTQILDSSIVSFTFNDLDASTQYAVGVAASSNACGEGRLSVVGVETGDASIGVTKVTQPIKKLPSSSTKTPSPSLKPSSKAPSKAPSKSSLKPSTKPSLKPSSKPKSRRGGAPSKSPIRAPAATVSA